MPKCRWMPEVAEWFDGETDGEAKVAQHVAECPVCAAYLRSLRALRTGTESVALRPAIEEAQLPAFLEGIRIKTARRPRRHTGLWAFASAAAASVIAALSLFLVFTGGSRDVAATVVESAATELEGATVRVYESDDTATIWVNVPGKEVW